MTGPVVLGTTPCSDNSIWSQLLSRLTAQQLDPALHRLRRLGVLDVLQRLVQQHVARRSVGLTDHLRSRDGGG